MPPISKLVSYVGLSKQTAKGAGAATPATFGFGVLDGKIFNVPITQDYSPLTLNGGTSDRFPPNVKRTEANPAATFRTRVWPKSIGLLLYAALGAKAVSGTGPFTHTITPDQTLPYLTLFARYGSDYEKLVDVLVDELTISWDERNPLEAALAMLGLTPSLGTAAFTVTSDETTQPFFGPVGGTLQLDTGSGTPAAAQIKAASVKIANAIEPVPLSRAITPDDLVPAQQTVEGTVTLVPNDLSDWKKIVTGSGSGSSLQSTEQYGSLSLKVTIDANNELTLASSRVAFLAEFPDSDPGGGAAELELAFSIVRPTDGSAAFTATLKNQQSSY